MTNIAIMWNMRHRTATWTAGSAKSTLPASHLGDDDPARVWQTAEGVDSTYVLADAGASVTMRGFVLVYYSGDASATLRLKVSTADATGAAGDAYDSGALNDFDPAYNHWIHLAPTEVTGRYVRLDITNSSQSRLEAATLAFGPVWTPEINVERGVQWSIETADRSTFSRSGAVRTDEGALRRVLSARLPAATAAEHDAQLLPFGVQVASRRPILMVRNPGAAALGPEAVWGRVRSPLAFPNVFHGRYGWAFEVAELLR